MDLFAAAAVCGLPVERIARADTVELALWNRVVVNAWKLHSRLMKDQAVLNANAVANMLKR